VDVRSCSVLRHVAHLSCRSSRVSDLRPGECTPIVFLERTPAEFGTPIGRSGAARPLPCGGYGERWSQPWQRVLRDVVQNIGGDGVRFDATVHASQPARSDWSKVAPILGRQLGREVAQATRHFKAAQ
jgi:hypothetical protein